MTFTNYRYALITNGITCHVQISLELSLNVQTTELLFRCLKYNWSLMKLVLRQTLHDVLLRRTRGPWLYLWLWNGMSYIYMFLLGPKSRFYYGITNEIPETPVLILLCNKLLSNWLTREYVSTRKYTVSTYCVSYY